MPQSRQRCKQKGCQGRDFRGQSDIVSLIGLDAIDQAQQNGQADEHQSDRQSAEFAAEQAGEAADQSDEGQRSKPDLAFTLFRFTTFPAALDANQQTDRDRDGQLVSPLQEIGFHNRIMPVDQPSASVPPRSEWSGPKSPVSLESAPGICGHRTAYAFSGKGLSCMWRQSIHIW